MIKSENWGCISALEALLGHSQKMSGEKGDGVLEIEDIGGRWGGGCVFCGRPD